MLREYHAQITREVLGEIFSPRSLGIIIAANLRQDDFLTGQIGHPEYHFDHNCFTESDAYIEEQRAIILETLKRNRDVSLAWEAFGRLTHTAQDFYAHSNYVRLWANQFPENELPIPERIDALDETLLNSPELRSGKIYALEILTYIPFLCPLMMRLLPKDAHAYMNLDAPEKGPLFPYAVEAAKKRTLFEHGLIVEEIDAMGDKSSVFFG